MEIGKKSNCRLCRQQIVWTGKIWDHVGEIKPRHIAIPAPFKKTMEDIYELAKHDVILNTCLKTMEANRGIVSEEDALIQAVCLLVESRNQLFSEVVRLKAYEPKSKQG